MLGVFLQFHKWKDLSNDVPYNLLSYEIFVPLRVSSVLNDNVLVDNEPANFPRQNEGPLEGYQRKLVSFARSVPRARSPKSQDISQGQMVWLTRGAGLSAVRWPYQLTGSPLLSTCKLFMYRRGSCQILWTQGYESWRFGDLFSEEYLLDRQ